MGQDTRKTVFNISGPYAVGKDTVLNEIQRQYDGLVHRVSTLTTRPTSREADPTYTHVDFDEMPRYTSKGQWIVTHQMGGKVLYATNIDEIRSAVAAGKICIHSVFAGPEGAGRMREIFGAELFSVALLASHGSVQEQLDVLRERLLTRARDDRAAIAARLANQVEPLSYAMANPSVKVARDGMQMRVFDDVIVNEDVGKTVVQVLELFRTAFDLKDDTNF